VSGILVIAWGIFIAITNKNNWYGFIVKYYIYKLKIFKTQKTKIFLVGVLKNKNYDYLIRVNIVKALGDTRTKEATPVLISILKDKWSMLDIRAEADKALKEIEGR
jgi:HEAT repeat protein